MMEEKVTALRFKKATEKTRLTKNTVAKLEPPGSGARWVYSDKVPRLAVCVRPNGNKAWYWVGRFGSQMLRYKLGGFPELSPENATKLCQKVSAKVANGTDPRAERQKDRTGLTLQEAFDDYLENYAKPKKKTWGQDDGFFRRHCSKLKARRIAAITEHDIEVLHGKLSHKRHSANRVLSLLKTLFDYHRVRPNPCDGVKRYSEKAKDRFLLPEELPRFFDALDSMPEEWFRDYVKMLLFAGQRSTNTREMTWGQVSFDDQTWKLPETKNGEVVVVHLCEPAMEILSRRKATATTPFVFPGKPGKPMTRPHRTWDKLVGQAGIENLTPHDLRRTLGSWQAMSGASLSVIGKSLGHKSVTATQIYARMNLDPVRASVNTAVDAILKQANGKGADDGEA